MKTLDGTKLSGFKQWCDARGHVLGVLERVRVSVKVDGVAARYYSPRLP